MTWLIEQQERQNVEDYQSYVLTKVLEGKRCPTYEGVVNLMKKGWNHEKVSHKRGQYPR